MLEVAHVEHWQCQFDKTEMTGAVKQGALACFTDATALGGAHAEVFWSASIGCHSVVPMQLVLAHAHSGTTVDVLPTQQAKLD